MQARLKASKLSEPVPEGEDDDDDEDEAAYEI
jgi:hypothetical protein